MPLSLAGIPLLCPSRELCEWVEKTIPVGDVLPWAAPTWPGPTLALAGVASHRGQRMPRAFRVNRYWTATGADRWGFGAFLASGAQVEQVRAAANGADGTTSTPVTLKMAAEGQASAEELAVDVTVLRIVPLTQLASDDSFSANNIYLIIVVDARFWWQSIPTPAWSPPIPPYGATGSVPSWSDLFTQVASALGATIAVDPIPADYLKPDASLNLAGAPAGPVLEALCLNCGLVLTDMRDGTYRAMNYANSLAARQADDASGVGNARTVRGGGDEFADAV